MKNVRGTALAGLVLAAAFFVAPVGTVYGGATFTVDSTGDADDAFQGDGICAINNDEGADCTLRAAIEEANASEDADTIAFSIGSGVQTIAPGSPLPSITDPVTIDGTTQPGFAGSPIIELNGTNANGEQGASGLVALAPVTIRGLVINRFTGDGAIGIGAEYGTSLIERNYIGTNVEGTLALGNRVGIWVIRTDGTIIGGASAAARNVISGNSSFGIFVQLASDTRVMGNYIGTDVTGSVDLGNGEAGVLVEYGSNNVIGGSTAGAGNVISGNGGDGVHIFDGGGSYVTTNNRVEGNFIGTDASGSVALGYQGFGVTIRGIGGGDSNTIVGGTTAGARNIISGNTQMGVYIRESGGNSVQGNYIGTDVSGTTDLGNGQAGVIVEYGSNNAIGGSTPGAGNVISGNDGDGVLIFGASFDGTGYNRVEGNFIGTDKFGVVPLGNQDFGVAILGFGDVGNSTVGGTAIGTRNIIYGNGQGGVWIRQSQGNSIQGNYVGVGTSGGGEFAPFTPGVLIEDATDNVIGGTSAAARNVISNHHWGVLIALGASANRIEGNYIGTDATGSLSAQNNFGVWIDWASDGNVVGGTATGAGNLISGNGDGVEVEGKQNRIEGNIIGLNAAGTDTLRNGTGVRLFGNGYPGNNVVGGSAPGARNVITGNQRGIDIWYSSGNTVQGNYIGTDPAGGSTLPTYPYTNEAGIFVLSSADNTIADNVIADQYIGINIEQLESTGNVLVGNKIGTNASGTQSIANYIGIELLSSANQNRIGGLTAAERNLISGNTIGVSISSLGTDSNTVLGNYIGTDASGTAALPNGIGIEINNGQSNTIGGIAPGARNVISGNSDGVWLRGSATGNKIQGNFIGVDASGSQALGNSSYGVSLQQLSSGANLIGGTDLGAGNVISANGDDAIHINGGTGANLVQGNLIGTDATGTAGLPSNRGVVIIESPNNIIGGNTSGARNVISNNGDGILIDGERSIDNVIQGNFIGTDITGTVAVGNVVHGILTFGPGTRIGGTLPGSGNLISGNYSGIGLSLASGSVVEGNLIGTDITGQQELGNSNEGVGIDNGSDNTIGGIAPGAANVIAFNGDGVEVSEPAATGNTIRGNSIHSNDLKGIDTVNGGNIELAPPLITHVGSASGTACANCTIDVYSDDEDEGRVYEGSTVADGSGNWSYGGAVVGPNVTATATDGAGNTSEFSVPCADGDGDGVCEGVDNCPNEAEDADGFEDQDGCPEPDNDGDGVLDAVDSCPNEAEDADGFQDSDGCPDPDNDADGVPDSSDLCPLESEDPDGFEDQDGCPEPGPVVGAECDGLAATIVGTTNGDVLIGTAGRDVISAGDGNDIIFGLSGDDVVCGGKGNDIVFAGRGHDRVFGEDGRDILIGGPGDDYLNGGAHRDLCVGGQGADTIADCE